MPTEPRNDDLVMSLVEQALGQAAEHREAYLRSACSKDPALFEQVWNYVKWEERMSGFLLNPLYPPPRNEHPFEPGQLLDGRFRIVREVAQGGMGVVYEAVDERLDRRIAIKCAKSGYHKRLPPEVRNASEISHPNVCKTYEIHTALTDEGEIDFVTMEFVEGQTLAERLRDGPLPQQEAQIVARHLCEGLAEAHRKQVVHGDLKTNNIILTQTAEGIRAVITDFGLARRPSSQQPAVQSGEFGGAPDYMAPELLKGGKPSVASDIYALAVMLYEMASGRRPFGVECTWEERLHAHPTPLKHRWSKILARCLEPEPARRCARVSEVAAAVAPGVSHRWWWTGAVAAVVVAGLTVALFPKTGLPVENIRLAVLPFETDAADRDMSDGFLSNMAEQLRHVKATRSRRLTVISLADAVQSKVGQPGRAAQLLGATHVLTGTLRRNDGRTLIRAYVRDVHLPLPVREWQAEYQPDKLRDIPVALAGVITGTFRLPPLATATSVNAAAYADFTRGVGLLERNGVDGALPLLEGAVTADPDSPLTHARLAEAQLLKYSLTNDERWLNQAILSFGSARQRNPDLAEVWFVSGLINESVGAYEAARDDLQRALEIEPQNADGWRRLGRVYQESDRLAEALTTYQKASEVQPGHFRNYQGLCQLYSVLGDYDQGIGFCTKLVAVAPDASPAHLVLAGAYLSWGRWALAENEARAALSLDATSAMACQILASALAYQGRYQEAISYNQQAINDGLATHLLYLNLGQTFRWANLPHEANEAYRKGATLAETELSKNSRDGIVRARLAYLYARLGERSRAESDAALALQLSPGSVEVTRWVVMAYEAAGDRQRALSLAENAPGESLRRLNWSPDVADLRADPRYLQLMQSHHIQ
jgi:eukaryotic-like serine/threonine-protein kinase